jgi:hypothetical protein
MMLLLCPWAAIKLVKKTAVYNANEHPNELFLTYFISAH